MKFTILILYRATPLGLSLFREERSQFVEKRIRPIIERFKHTLILRLFDSEAYHAHTSDFIILQTDNLQEYYYFTE